MKERKKNEHFNLSFSKIFHRVFKSLQRFQRTEFNYIANIEVFFVAFQVVQGPSFKALME